MPRSFPAFAVGGLAFGFALALAGQASAQVQLGGTGGAMGMVERVVAAYAAAGGPEIEVIHSLGSSGAINAVADGAIDLAISARPLRPAESERGLTAVALGRTPLVLATSRQVPPGLSSADIPDIFASLDPEWPDGAALRIVLRPPSDTDAVLVADYFPGLEQAMEAARQRPEIPVAATDQDNATLAEELPGSLVYAGLCQLLMERRNLRTVAIDGVEPTLENLESGAYPYEKQFYLVYAAAEAEAAQALLGFLRSPDGEAVLREAGCLPHDQ